VDAKRIIVVGAGPAGMMAAIRAAQLGRSVLLLEKNSSPGQKLLLSGKGRCNLTNTCDLDSFIERFSGNGQFLRDAFKHFFYPELMSFFEARGLKLQVERQLRVFPESDRSAGVLKVLEQELKKNNVKGMYGSALQDIVIREKKAEGAILDDGRKIVADRIILATGGASYAFTGSTGEGIRIAEKTGHRTVPLRAGLVPLVTKEHYSRQLMGLTLKNIRLRFSASGKEILSQTGELLFTDFGISGPLVLSLSGRIVECLSAGKNVFAEIDLKPALSEEQLDSRLLREFGLNPKKSIKNTMKELLPRKLIDVALKILAIKADKKVSQITQAERKSVIAFLKGFRLTIAASRPLEEGMVTRGGVSLKDIDPRTIHGIAAHKRIIFCRRNDRRGRGYRRF
jgi:predicted Rossmann fold flavoprotein